MSERTYYVVLGVSPRVSPAAIRAAYRELAKKHHPDISGEQGAKAFQEIAEAYRVLSDPRSRREYDERLRHASRAPAGVNRSRDRASPAEPLAAHGPFPGHIALRADRSRSVEFELVLTLEEARQGGIVRLAVPVVVTCDQCAGAGYDWLFVCTGCAGHGLVELEPALAVEIPPMSPPGVLVEVPLDGPGVHDVILRLHVSVDG